MGVVTRAAGAPPHWLSPPATPAWGPPSAANWLPSTAGDHSGASLLLATGIATATGTELYLETHLGDFHSLRHRDTQWTLEFKLTRRAKTQARLKEERLRLLDIGHRRNKDAGSNNCE